jgi:hypothetical protein
VRALRVVVMVGAVLVALAACSPSTSTPPAHGSASPSASNSPLPPATDTDVLAYALARLSAPGYRPTAEAPACADKGFPARWKPAALGSAAAFRLCYRGVRYPDGRFGVGTMWAFDNTIAAQAALPMRFGKPSGDAVVLPPGVWTKLPIDDFHQTYLIRPQFAASVAAVVLSGVAGDVGPVTVGSCTPPRVTCQLAQGMGAAGLTPTRSLNLWGKGATVAQVLRAVDGAMRWTGSAYTGRTPQGKALANTYAHRAAAAPGLLAPPTR